jgi:hypothetical protein
MGALDCLPNPYGPKGSAPEASPSMKIGSPQMSSPGKEKRKKTRAFVEQLQPWPLPYQAFPSLN